MGKTVVVAEHRLVLGAPDDREDTAGMAGVRGEGCRLTEGAGGFVVNRERERFPGRAYKGMGARSGEAGGRGWRRQPEGHPDQEEREGPGHPPHYTPRCHRPEG